jgi:photosystem II stability/assembly factor-like uncharacterized protein
MQKSEISSSSSSNDEKPGPDQSAFGWLIGLATLLLLGSVLFAWKQPPNPDANRTAASGWIDDLRYPIEQNAFKRVTVINDNLRAIFALEQRVWAVGDRGLIVHSEDGGKTWEPQTSGTREQLFSITFHADGQQGWAASLSGTILKTVDGGKTWEPQTNRTQAALFSITFHADGQQGWAAGDGGTILKTMDGGKSWEPQTSGTEASLFSITFHADGQQGWAAGDGGTILKTVDGGKTWERQNSGTQEWLRSITFHADGQQGWAASEGGTILKTVDGGKTWEPQTNRTEAALRNITFHADGRQGWAAGFGGTILETVDGGKTWELQTSGTRERLHSITFHADGRQGWAAGDGGTILKTMDGGKSWEPQTSGTREWLYSITFHADGQQGWAAGRDGTILKTVDGGKTWEPQTSGTGASLSSITFHADGQQGWAAGRDGTILKTVDGGKTWEPQTSGTGASLSSITFHADGQQGWAVGLDGTILKTMDGGKSWEPQTSGTEASLFSITFHTDGQQGWAAGDGGTILKTMDGGKSWEPQTSGTEASLFSITFHADGQQGWAAGDGGTILKTVDGGKAWEPQTSGTREPLISITFHADGQQGWAAGDGGTILKTVDGGKAWEPQTSGTREPLISITFHADGQQGWAAGFGGAILKTMDGGKTWQAITYRFYPAPWFYVAALIALLIYAAAFWWRARLNNQFEQTQSSTAMNRGVTDNPAGPGEQDLLGARLIADSLTRFLTNENTRPPLTLAITGEWGSGKSSVMNYLSANLKRKGLKPVWFNAWHHREEPSVLASILANVHKQAIKPWWRLSGLWFRLRLLWRRHWLWKTLLLILFASLAFMVTWLSQTGKWNETWRYALYTLKIEQPVMLGEKGFRQLCPEWASVHDDSEPVTQEKSALAEDKTVAVPRHKPLTAVVYVNPPGTAKDIFGEKECNVLHELHNHERIRRDELNCLTSVPPSETKQACFASPNVLLKTVERRLGATLSLDDEKTLQSAMEYLSPDLPVLLPNAFVSWLTALSALLLFLAIKGMALLGLAPVSFIQGFLRTTGAVGEVTEKVGTRLLFESHFRAITRLLGQRRLVLFIDDLDRCDPEHTRKVLEISNFLSSSGELFMVIGMSTKHVLINVTLGFKETAQKHDDDPANVQPDQTGKDSNTEQQNGFARSYLHKLIHIVVPVPKPETAQIKALLTGNLSSQSKAEARMIREEKREARADKILAFSAAVVRRSLFFLAIAAGIYLGMDSADQTRKEEKQSAAAAPQSPAMTVENKAAATESSAKQTGVKDRPEETASSKGELFKPAYTKDNFQEWPLQIGVALALFAVVMCMLFFVLLQRLNKLDDKEWLSWIKPLLQRLKIALLGPEPVKDTQNFTEALEIWHPLIAQKDPTPRTIKAFLNRLRYLVSRRTSSLDSDQRPTGDEAQLVALAAISYVYWKDFDEILGHADEPEGTLRILLVLLNDGLILRKNS